MTDDALQENQDAQTDAGRSNAILIALVSLLAVAIAALVLDRRARSASNAALTEIEEMVNQDELPTREAVRDALGRPPDEVYDTGDGRQVEEYRWSGGVRDYKLYVYVDGGPAPAVTAVTLNQLLEGVSITPLGESSAD